MTLTFPPCSGLAPKTMHTVLRRETYWDFIGRRGKVVRQEARRKGKVLARYQRKAF